MSKILEIHDKISNENKTAYLMGDYNLNLLNFDSQTIYILTKLILIMNLGLLCMHYVADHFGIFHLTYGTPPKQKSIYNQICQLKITNILTFRNLLARAD